MAKPRDVQAQAANGHQKELLTYNVSNMICVLTQNMKIEKPSKELNHKMIGPYPIKTWVESPYQLESLASIKIHNIFHPNLLWKAATDPLPDQYNDVELLVIIDDEKRMGSV